MIIGDLVIAGFLHGRLAIGQRAGGSAERNADPVVGLVALAVFLARGSSNRHSACRDIRRRRRDRSACRYRRAGLPPSRARCPVRCRCSTRPRSAGGYPPSRRSRRASRFRSPAGISRCWRGRWFRPARRSARAAGCARLAPFSIGSFGAATSARGTGWAATRSASAASAAPPGRKTQRVAPRDDAGHRALPAGFGVSEACYFAGMLPSRRPAGKARQDRQFRQQAAPRPACRCPRSRLPRCRRAPRARRRARRHAGRADRSVVRPNNIFCSAGSPPKWPPGLVRNADPLGARRNCASRRPRRGPAIGPGLALALMDLDAAAMAVEGELIPFDRHEGVERIRHLHAVAGSGSLRSSCRECRSPRGTRRHRGNSRPLPRAPRRACRATASLPMSK